jgi:hypothetical protein
MHDWSTTAALANECAYQINPSAFAGYRSLIFARSHFKTPWNSLNCIARLE